MPKQSPLPLEVKTSDALVDYVDAVAFMEARVAQIHEKTAPECLWLLQHPPLYTAGTSADPKELLDPERFPVFESGRGGRYTYHGPGQRIAYVMLDLSRRERDLRAFVRDLESWLIATLAEFGVHGERRSERIGIWVAGSDGEEQKIAALGVRLRRWVSYHGVSINVDPDLSHFTGIVPCGIADHQVTSLRRLGLPVSMAELDRALTARFFEIFGDGG